ncbi:unnamed protein product, partial [marine sediment metagenome]
IKIRSINAVNKKNPMYGRYNNTPDISSCINSVDMMGVEIKKISKYQGDKITQVNKIHPCISAEGGNKLRGIGIQQKNYSIRRFTPIECERLQGFPDNWTRGISELQRYKCLGNAVTVNVIREIIKKLLRKGDNE